MEVNTTPIPARGEATVTIAGQPVALRFSLAVLHAYCTQTGQKLTDIAQNLGDDPLGTIGQLLTAAVRRTSRKEFTLDDALEVMEDMPQAESNDLAAAIWSAIQVDKNPLMKALIAQAQPAAPSQEPQTSGVATSTPPSAT